MIKSRRTKPIRSKLRRRFESDSIHGPNIREAKTRVELARAIKAAKREWLYLTKRAKKIS